jgi:hypothetical protein
MQARFILRPDSHGYSIRDLLSGEPAIVAGAPQTGLTRQDAEHTAELLNRREADVPSNSQRDSQARTRVADTPRQS